MIKYLTVFTEAKIVAMEIVRETKHKIVLSHGFRVNKVSDWRNYHDSWDEAHKFLTAEAEKQVRHYTIALETAKAKLKNIQKMTPEN